MPPLTPPMEGRPGVSNEWNLPASELEGPVAVRMSTSSSAAEWLGQVPKGRGVAWTQFLVAASLELGFAVDWSQMHNDSATVIWKDSS